ncbi:hypothetical protein L1049_001192 [Liquidambar formosana]|uniref:Uncharacterized protein n=1 Tax=Liquidambar formosana TaxID=63359 RepID=A0AAP0NE88_LIQFO
MDIRNWCSSGTETIQLGRRCYNEIESTSPRSNKQMWKVLWRKLKKEKRKFFESSVHVQQVPYDAYTYSQNFDQGSVWDEPDNLSRSFSARFADPSRVVFLKKGIV